MNNLNLDIIKEVHATTLKTGRTYHTPDGDFPSITTILGKTANQMWLQRWRDKVGEEEANRISKEATDRGTKIHEYLERYWNGEDIFPDLTNDYEYIDIQNMTRNLVSATQKHVGKMYAQEIPLWDAELGYAGRVDMIGEWKGVDSVIDFKTSKKRKYLSGIKDYYIQCAGYCSAFNKMFNTNISKLVILITVENKGVQAFYGDVIHYLPDLKYRINLYNSLAKE